MAFFYASIGEVVDQVYEVKAGSWEEAKQKAFPRMAEGDLLVECPPEVVKTDDRWPEHHYIEENECIKYAHLRRGTWANCGITEYWEDRAWYFTDMPENYMDANGADFMDWNRTFPNTV